MGKLTKLQTERATWMEELAKQDTRIARTLELETILESLGRTILEFEIIESDLIPFGQEYRKV